ncbi:MAG: phospholipase D family protein [Pseudomonadota bacterium]
MHPILRILGLALAAALTGCAGVDFDAPKTPSYYTDVDVSETTLGASLGRIDNRFGPGKSGFYPLGSGIDALSARILLIERAEKTLDVQYYLVGNDPIGDLFFHRLLNAADRGVRVRLLIDDIGTRSIEHKLAPLDAHPNLQLRLFNPFASRGNRLWDLWDGRRLNRRMHNKSLTADGSVTIMGGRNIAGEYFGVNPKYNFGDLDVVAVGPVVPDTAKMFDRFWNATHSVPYVQLIESPATKGDLSRLVADLEASIETLLGTPYRQVVNDSIEVLSYTTADSYTWAPYKLVYDAPDSALAEDTAADQLITSSLRQVAEAAENEMLVLSPYFVPRKAGVEWLTGLADKGVQIDIMTNGLAANDHLVVYGGYAPVRKPLIRQGVRFYEMRGDLLIDGTKEAGIDAADSKLHGKAFIVDRKYVFIGSFNWDPRSANLNTEMGVIFHDAALGQEMAAGVYRILPSNTYEVTLNDAGDIRWRTHTDGVLQVFEKEPESDWWQRFKANLTRLLPIRGLL